ncbi:MAG TPA: DNA-processing protein DprA, partial [Candidatus Limnocylindrales bacterium]
LRNVGTAIDVLERARPPDGDRFLLAASREPLDDDRWSPPSLTPRAAALLVGAARAPDEIAASIRAAGLEILTVHDPDYPPRLRWIDLPPHVLFIRGERSALAHDRAVAVVGTRRPTEHGRRIAARLATVLSRTRAAVVSGLAVGIDGAAHAAVIAELELTAGQGPTVAVLGGGHARLFPRAHRRLADRIVDTGGALVSEFAPATEPSRGTFPRRNRIISGLSEATIVVEARIRSGALITAAWALQQGRACYLVPGRIDDPASSGCLEFLREAGGEARIVASVDLLLEDLGLASVPDGAGHVDALAPLVELGETGAMVGERLVRGLTTVDELVASTGLPVASVLAALTMLETRGLVIGAYGRYRPAGRLAGRPTAVPTPR